MKDESSTKYYVALLTLALAIVFMSQLTLGQYGPGNNNRNYTVRSTVNITNSFPQIISIFPEQGITLTAGGTTIIDCNLSILDFDGGSTVGEVNATFFDSNFDTFSSPDDNNTHYSNNSCTQTAVSGTIANFTCSFEVYYFANNGSNWNCTAFVSDDAGAEANRTNATTVNALLALNITPDVIDFGNLAVTQISGSVEANITNFGNVPINVSVRGFGGVENDNLAMVCEQNNITVDQERFGRYNNTPWASMTALTSSNQAIGNLTVAKQLIGGVSNYQINSTYWRLRIPSVTNPGGECNGSVVFQAELS